MMRALPDFGLKGSLLEFINNFLSNRTFQVRIGPTLSDEKPRTASTRGRIACASV